MNIGFIGIAVPTLEGLNFQATVDGESVSCQISSEALQDIDSRLIGANPLVQFRNSESAFQSIARQKISNGEIESGNILITALDNS